MSGRVESTIPPGCWEGWRGWPWASRARSASSRQRCVPARFAPIASAMLSATASRLSKTSTIRATRSTSPSGSPSDLAEVAHGAARAVGGEGGDEGRALRAVALVDARDQPLADVAREVEVDVRDLGDLLVQEAAEEELVAHRVDVREAGEVTDDRAHARATATARGQEHPRRVRAADLGGDLPSQLQQVVVQQEEAGEPQRPDHPQLLVEPAPRLGELGRVRVAVLEPALADLGERVVGALVLGAGVAVAEVAGQVELDRSAIRPLSATASGWSRKQRGRGRGRRAQPGAGVAAAPRLGLLQRRPEPHRDQRVLQRARERRACGRCRWRRTGRRAARRSARGGGCGRGRGARTAAAARPGSGRGRRRRGARLGVLALRRALAGAAGEADDAVGVLLERRQGDGGGEWLAAGLRPRARVGGGREPAEVAVARDRLREEGDVKGTVPSVPGCSRSAPSP